MLIFGPSCAARVACSAPWSTATPGAKVGSASVMGVWSSCPRRRREPLEPALLVGIAILHELDHGTVDEGEGDAQEGRIGCRVERLRQHLVTVDRTPNVVDAVGD